MRICLASAAIAITVSAFPAHAQSVDRDVERDDGKVTRTITAESSDGRTASLEQQRERTENGATSTTTRTGPEGQSVSLDRFTEKTENGREGGAIFTDRNGDTASRDYSRSFVEGEGFTRSATATARDGRTANVNASGGCSDGACSRNRSATGFDGRSRGVANSAERREDGSILRRRTVTPAEGEVRSRERTRQRPRRSRRD